MGLALQEKKKPEEAIELIRRPLQSNLDYAEVSEANMGKCAFQDLGKLEKSIEAYKKCPRHQAR